MGGLILDFVCYIGLILALYLATRVRKAELVSIKVLSQTIPGRIKLIKSSVNSRVGLLNTPHLEVGDGVLLLGAKSVHTKGMSFPIDLIFLDERLRILEFKPSVMPEVKKVSGPSGTKSTLELGPGSIEKFYSNIANYSQLSLEVIGE